MRVCSVDGCGKKHLARGLCSTHYNQQHQPNRHRKITVACDYCDEPCEKDKSRKFAARFCSLDCRDWTRRAVSCPVPDDHPSRSTPVPLDHPSRWNGQTRSCRVFLPDCAVCGRCFATPYTLTTCSPSCAKVKRQDDKREQRHRERARRTAAFVAPVLRRRIFERDGWMCKLCHLPVLRDATVPHPLAPTIDHVIPFARGGTHEPANCQTAHYSCNCAKGARGGGEQLPLVGQTPPP